MVIVVFTKNFKQHCRQTLNRKGYCRYGDFGSRKILDKYISKNIKYCTLLLLPSLQLLAMNVTNKIPNNIAAERLRSIKLLLLNRKIKRNKLANYFQSHRFYHQLFIAPKSYEMMRTTNHPLV